MRIDIRISLEMKKILVSFISCLWSIQFLCAQYQVQSPDKKVDFLIDISEEGSLSGKILFNREHVLTAQLVNFEFNTSMPELKNKLMVIDTKITTTDETWIPVLKRFDKVRNNYTEILINLQEKVAPKRKLQLIARVYNDGVAYRIKFPKSVHGVDYLIKEEHSTFSFGEDRVCWAADHIKPVSPQESFFYKRNISELTQKMLIGLPLTVKISDKCFAAITEADLTDYAGMYLKKEQDKFGLSMMLSPSIDSSQTTKVTKKEAFNTPWRVVLVGETPGRLVESELINNLNPPCAIEDPSWIKPGISAWDNWYSNDVKMDEPTIKQFIDLASDMTWPYMIVDWQWYGEFNKPQADITKSAPNINMPQLIQYAKEKNVKLILWLYWTDVNRSDWDAVCALYEKWGIAGVKIDFMDRDDQEMVNWYERIVKTAAKHKLMVNFHGAYKPTGLGRTYPNQVTREGVLGNEWNKWSLMVTPEHLCTLPFTRMLAGPMDFTPGGFENRKIDDFRIQSPTQSMLTRSNTLAQFVVFDSPLTVACDHPNSYKNQVGSEFLKKVKTVWDDTKVLNGAVGEYITMARRDKKNWFIGTLNNSETRTLTLKLDFLGEGKFKIISYEDDALANKALQKEKIVTNKSEIKIALSAGGGFAAYLEPSE
ncbi:glycoside hydrolase family 97 protein [Pedobacter glucosidilyticus]|uniref:glycoside hydrolase family 97 protein n=1 Tax=Pedobacter glucosidilyticus TaxID=1122941 RepID=UPI0026ED9434|nr:glycoside hydrolase family 97 protein [Pedobacter glucosidilyticus]